MANLTAYRAVLAAQARGQRSYRTNFTVDLLSSFTVAVVELLEVWILFHNVPQIGGLRFAQVALMFGIADSAFSTADLILGHVDRLPTYLKAGTLDVFYLRPQPLLAQLIFSDISLRRATRVCVGVAALIYGLVVNEISWTLTNVALLTVALVSAFAISAALFVLAAGCQFFVIDGRELTNSFVYGGRYAATQPASVWSTGLRIVFAFLVPTAFIAYLPVLRLLDLPSPDFLPSWLGWCAPIAAAWTWLVAMLMWRTGVRHYQGGGG